MKILDGIIKWVQHKHEFSTMKVFDKHIHRYKTILGFGKYKTFSLTLKPFLIAYDDMTHKSKGNYRTYNWPCPFLRTFFCKDFKCWSRSETATIVLISHFTLKLATVPTLLPKCERQTVEISLTTLAKSWLAHLSAGNRGLRVWGPAIMGFASVSCICWKLSSSAGIREKLDRNLRTSIQLPQLKKVEGAQLWFSFPVPVGCMQNNDKLPTELCL